MTILSSALPTQVRSGELCIAGATVLTPQGWTDAAVTFEAGRITEVGTAAGSATFNAQGLLLLPGIVDIHGDAFERALSPRQGVTFPLPLALRENDAALIAAGITTWFCSVSDSYEDGLRSREMARAIIAFLADNGRSSLTCDTRLHLRHEVCHVDGHDELLGWLKDGIIDLLSWADHVPFPGDAVMLRRFIHSLVRRGSFSDAQAEALAATAGANRERGWAQIAELARCAIGAGIPCASHDDASPAAVIRSAELGASIAEFPQDAACARFARSRGMGVLMGSPNYVRGGSHLGCLGAKDALRAGALDALCSDYHYASVFAAPFLMDAAGDLPLAEAWQLVSSAPARLVGLAGVKGAIAPGYDADLLLVSPGEHPRLMAVYIAGREVARFG